MNAKEEVIPAASTTAISPLPVTEVRRKLIQLLGNTTELELLS